MKTAMLTAKIDPQVKELAQKTASDLGVSLSFVIDQLLRKFNQEKRIVVEEFIPNAETIRAIEEAIEDRKNGRISPGFDNIYDLMKSLENID